MSAQAASITSLLSTLLLSDHRILRLSWATPFAQHLDWNDLREPTYLAYQPWAARFPDHVFDSAWRSLGAQQKPRHCVALTALQALIGEYLELRHGEVRVQSKNLGAWQQGVISRLSSAPIQAWADVAFGAGRYGPSDSSTQRQRWLDRSASPWERQVMPLLRSEEAALADYVEREGLHETHLHLNGSTHAEICWLRAIRNPRLEVRDFVSAWTRSKNSDRIRELARQANPELTPLVFQRHLRVAGRLRAWLVAAAKDRVAPEQNLPNCCEILGTTHDDEWAGGTPLSIPLWRDIPDVADELSWMAVLLARLRQRPSIQLSRMLHAYLLLQNEYYRLLVQSESQYGFDQFQKFTLTELREPAEKDYLSRFHAMHGARSTRSTVGYLEGRFAPKADPVKASRLLHSILGGYLHYLRDSGAATPSSSRHSTSLSETLNELDRCFAHRSTPDRSIHRLALVAHFIKEDWPPKEKNKAGPYRHYPLDVQLRRAADALLLVLSRWPKLQTWVRGVDAAANELHAPPDAFAPVFRVCNRAGLTRRTYHAGEDFRHLLSGIATMWEALQLLELRDGDRIGHGTAMGINPRLWLERMPASISLPRGEWMFGLLAAWQLLRDVPGMQACVHHLQYELEDVAHQIFQRTLTVSDLQRAMALRGLSRRDLMRYLSNAEAAHQEPMSRHWREEFERVRFACVKQPEAVDLLWKWMSDPEVQTRASEFISKEAEFLDAKSYVQLQQALMWQVAKRGVLIETLPSSNVRISQYHHIDEHHCLRWMRIPGHIEEGDPEIMICLGSDDPGIFAADIETEFYLLYTSLRKKGLSDSMALERLSVLNERGRVYRFHHPALS
ncbi:MAG: hypothetical protein K0S02_2390 [Achromobacter mucicolens]|jgi:hypothetical protein|uniref:hypothetical protein n=1 Tax=Achromobacter mucicolens TaxID=1389922 RepID=UPI00242D19BA|nr:hypothetical protein [Achromobacter mucicolens]MDF2862118.1 hypothetical protein [Achromobacter mucicolens]